jgi:hypothetical protein
VQNFYGAVFRHGIITGMLLATVTAQAEWLLHDSASACVLETDKITWPDGYQDTSVRLNINEQRLLVMTGSNVDTGIDDTALQVDGQAVITAVSAVDEQNLRFDTGMPALIEQFRKGNRVRIYMRFWPSYPATERFEIPFSLMGFTHAWNDYMACVEKDSE